MSLLNSRNGRQHERVAEQALQYVKGHRVDLIRAFSRGFRDSHPDHPLAIFLAGSPGAGKTEYGISLIGGAEDILRIEADAIRGWLPMYNGVNASALQQATSRGVDLLVNHCLQKRMSFLLDSTFTPWRIAEQNVRRCLSRKYLVQVHYVYQEPTTAWLFMKKREAAEGRSVPTEAFIRKFLEAYENVRKVKALHGKSIDLTVAIKDFAVRDRKLFEHVKELETALRMGYTADDLQSLLRKI